MTQDAKQLETVFNLFPMQDEFIFSDSRFPCLETGIGVGKTAALIIKAVKHCEDYPKAKALIIRKEFTDLRDSTIADFTTYTGKTLNKDHDYIFPNTSTILFRHGNKNDLSVLKNINLSFIGIEQGEEYEDDEVFMWGRDRLRRIAHGGPCQLAMIANSNGMNWIWSKFIQPATTVINNSVDVRVLDRMMPTEEMYYSHETIKKNRFGKEIKQKWELWSAASWINAANLSDETLMDWLSMETDAPNHYARMILNRHDVFGDTDMLLTSYDIQKALNQEFCFDSPLFAKNRIMGCDIARGGDDCVAVILEQCGPAHWRESYFETWKHTDTMYTTGRLMSIRAQHTPKVMVVDGDGLGAGVIDRIKENGIPVVEYRGGMTKHMREPTRYANQRTEDAFFMKKLIQDSKLRILPEVVPDCQIVRFGYNSSGGKKQLTPKDKLPRSPDHFDALMMACSQVHNPEVYHSTSFMFNQQQYAKARSPFAGVR